MGSERHDRLTRIFAGASALGTQERGAYLDEACAGDLELREEVESLLDNDARSEELLSASGMGRHIRSVLDELSDLDAELPRPSHVGPYRIVGVLGEGGQGIVFRAEQRTPKRIVALKVIRAGSLATKEDLRRFRKEIRALALLHHPTIATIFDGGHTDEGQHYFTMEFVDGAPVNTYARERSLSVKERLELFCKICDGVEYAHGKGVIHRDLKPSNILVDAEGNPKILDFGLVRITDADISSVCGESRTGFIVGSLRYMSPEQARGKQAEIRTQSDLYSLGMILYELLTGQRPYELGDSLPEAVQIICEAQPPPPSAVDGKLRGDPDTIVATALEKDPSRRYGSVAQLAADIRRFLQGEPIHARPPSLVYALGKKMRKHRLAFALVAAVAVLAAAGFGFRAWSIPRQIQRARERAVHLQYALERLPADQMLGIAQSLFDDHPTLPEAVLVLAQAQFRAGVSYRATHYLRLGIDNDRDAWAFRMLLARVSGTTNPELTERLEKQALLEFPDTAHAWYLRSFATFDVQEAIRAAGTALARDGRHTLAMARLAHLCERADDLDCAYEAATGLLEAGPGRRGRLGWTRFQALILMRQGKFRQAIDLFNSVLTSGPARPPRFLTGRALAYLCLKDYERAVADYTAFIDSAKTPDSWVSQWRATPLWILGRLEEAAEDYQSFRSTQGTVSYADARLFLLRHDRARLFGNRERSAEADALLEKAEIELEAARRSVEDGKWLRKILDCLSGELAPEKLIEAADRSNREQVCEAYYYAAEMSLLSGRIEDARNWFSASVATGLLFDTNELADPMAEYHLASWRVSQLEDGI